MDDPRLMAALAGLAPVLAGIALALWRREGGWPAMAIPLGMLVALSVLFGGVAASPRQLGERLPMLSLLLCAPALLGAARPRPWIEWPVLGLAALLGGWWMSGAAVWGPDLARAWPLLAALAVATLLPGLALARPWQGALLPLGTALLLTVAAPPGPWGEAAQLVAVLGVASLGFGPVMPLAGRMATAPMLVALTAGPVIALGRWVDLGVAALLALASLLGAGWPEWRGRLAQGLLLLAAAAALAMLG